METIVCFGNQASGTSDTVQMTPNTDEEILSDGKGPDRIGRDRMGRDGMGWDGAGQDGMGWVQLHIINAAQSMIKAERRITKAES